MKEVQMTVSFYLNDEYATEDSLRLIENSTSRWLERLADVKFVDAFFVKEKP